MLSVLRGKLTQGARALRVTPPPPHSREWIRPGTQGWEPQGWAWGWAAGEGLAGLPPRKWADSGALLPPGPEPSDRSARRAPAGPAQPPAALAEADRTELPEDGDPLGVFHLQRGAGPCRAPVRCRSTPLFPVPMDPPRCALLGGAGPSQVPAGRGVSGTLIAVGEGPRHPSG